MKLKDSKVFILIEAEDGRISLWNEQPADVREAKTLARGTVPRRADPELGNVIHAVIVRVECVLPFRRGFQLVDLLPEPDERKDLGPSIADVEHAARHSRLLASCAAPTGGGEALPGGVLISIADGDQAVDLTGRGWIEVAPSSTLDAVRFRITSKGQAVYEAWLESQKGG